MKSRITIATGLISIALLSPAMGESWSLEFDSPVPGTIADTNGLGTGFTHRLPRTGGSLLANDANLDLVTKPGSLLITSTNADLNLGGFNLDILESPTIVLSGVGAKDLSVSAMVKGINLGFASDHLSIVVGNSGNDSLRASIHHGAAPSGADNTYVFTENWSGSGYGDDNTFNSGFYNLHDSIIWSVNRVNGKWSMSWENLDHPELSGASPLRSLPWLDSSPDLYVGLYHVNPRTATQRTNEIEYFRATVVPEPIAIVPAVIALGFPVIARIRLRRVGCQCKASA